MSPQECVEFIQNTIHLLSSPLGAGTYGYASLIDTLQHTTVAEDSAIQRTDKWQESIETIVIAPLQGDTRIVRLCRLYNDQKVLPLEPEMPARLEDNCSHSVFMGPDKQLILKIMVINHDYSFSTSSVLFRKYRPFSLDELVAVLESAPSTIMAEYMVQSLWTLVNLRADALKKELKSVEYDLNNVRRLKDKLNSI